MIEISEEPIQEAVETVEEKTEEIQETVEEKIEEIQEVVEEKIEEVITEDNSLKVDIKAPEEVIKRSRVINTKSTDFGKIVLKPK